MVVKNNAFKPIAACQNSILNSYLQQIHTQKKLLAQIKAVLPTQINEGIEYCVIADKKLLLYVSSGLWTSQLRFYEALILQNVSHLSQIEVVRVRLIERVSSDSAHKTKRQAKIPSTQAIDALRENAQLIDDDKLSQSLLRLSQTLELVSKHKS